MKRFLWRFVNTYEGFKELFIKDKNFIIHLYCAVLVVVLGLLFNLSQVEWLFIVTAIFAVLITETINTAIEATVDLVTRDYHPMAKIAKDISAFAVLLASIYAVIVATIIFLPYIF